MATLCADRLLHGYNFKVVIVALTVSWSISKCIWDAGRACCIVDLTGATGVATWLTHSLITPKTIITSYTSISIALTSLAGWITRLAIFISRYIKISDKTRTRPCCCVDIVYSKLSNIIAACTLIICGHRLLSAFRACIIAWLTYWRTWIIVISLHTDTFKSITSTTIII